MSRVKYYFWWLTDIQFCLRQSRIFKNIRAHILHWSYLNPVVTIILIDVSSGVEDTLPVGSGRRVLGKSHFFPLHNPFNDTKAWVLHKVQWVSLFQNRSSILIKSPILEESKIASKWNVHQNVLPICRTISTISKKTSLTQSGRKCLWYM